MSRTFSSFTKNGLNFVVIPDTGRVMVYDGSAALDKFKVAIVFLFIYFHLAISGGIDVFGSGSGLAISGGIDFAVVSVCCACCI